MALNYSTKDGKRQQDCHGKLTLIKTKAEQTYSMKQLTWHKMECNGEPGQLPNAYVMQEDLSK